MKGRPAPELAAAAIFTQLDFLHFSDERRYYQNSSLAANFHCSWIHFTGFSMAAIPSCFGKGSSQTAGRVSMVEGSPRPRELEPE